mmetsp:Transcript_23144/g.33914  ORF Transcript_23144/g.33914 Transcript_23144/m.33914 type:complete len:398 (-) Transcript_23144:67-1260(-)
MATEKSLTNDNRLSDDGEHRKGQNLLESSQQTMPKFMDVDIDTWCIPVSIFLGVLVGLFVPGSSELSVGYRTVSSVIGWIYFFAWTLSFYPQVFLNAARRTTTGMVSDKLVYDFIGFSSLSVYCVALYCVGSVREEYRNKYNGNNPKVQINDVCFAVHALILTFVQIGQMAYYNGWKQLPSKPCLYGSAITLVIIGLYLALVLVIDSNVFVFLYWLQFISFVKIGVTMIKYVPQALLNYTRKSTQGWSITTCTLDLIGSTLSLLQLMLDCYDTNDWSAIVGDLVKFALGLVSMLFDFIFIAQHYVLYPNSDHGVYSPLLDDEYTERPPDSSPDNIPSIPWEVRDEPQTAANTGTTLPNENPWWLENRNGASNASRPPEDESPVYYTDEACWVSSPDS